MFDYRLVAIENDHLSCVVSFPIENCSFPYSYVNVYYMVNYTGLAGITVNKGNHPQMALILASEIS